MRADACIDLAGEDLPAQRFKEITGHVIKIHSMQEHEKQCSAHLRERKEQQDLDTEEMVQAEKPGPLTTLVNHPQQGERTDATNC